jgi:hypothetical protein
MDFARSTFRDAILLQGEASAKRGIFREATIQRHDNPETAPAGNAEYLLIFDVDGWHLKDAVSRARTKIVFRRSQPDPPSQLLAFLEALETAARDVSNAKTK